ncbi:hypothetical protein [Faecalibaculum rodentium]|uniref:hypothetical protein n=1 Tax=Faecalibaculum rodentium TaxID=1702221 RepID=UPI00272A2129|nr:hypothetical protein [Faecalibaculum rodentium]
MSSGHMVRVIRTDTGESWDTIRDAASGLGVSLSCLGKARAKSKTSVCGIPIRFLETRINRNAKIVREIETGELYPSATDAAAAIGVEQPDMCNAIKTGRRIHGKRFVYAQ